MRRFRVSIAEALALIGLGIILALFHRHVDYQLTVRATGLAVRPDPMPWVIISSFGLWLVVWTAASYGTLRRKSPNTSSGTAQASFLVETASTYFVANGMCLLTIGVGDAPALPMLTLVVLIGFVSTLGSRSIRDRLLLWAVAAALAAGVFVYDFHLWGENIASC